MREANETLNVLPVSSIPEPGFGKDVLTDVLRRGAREFLALAVEQEVQEWLNEPMHALDVHRPTFATQQPRDLAITETRTFAHQFQHPPHQTTLFVILDRRLPLSRSRLTNRPARLAFARVERLLHMLHGLTAASRAYQFPELTSFRI
jgi:hypothetical protein